MRRLTEADLAKIKGSTIEGYYVEAVRIKQGPHIDSDNYGFILGRNTANEYVTWQFHILVDESVSVYWGHYIEDREEALRDFDARSMGMPRWFDVTIIETLQMTIRVEAHSQQEAKQIISNDWKNQELVLGPECFAGVEFDAKPIEEQNSYP